MPQPCSSRPSGVPRRAGWAALAAPAALAAVALAAPGEAHALGYIAWSSSTVPAARVEGCFDLAGETLAKARFASVRRTTDEVTGNHQGTYATITCIGTRPKATAVVMVIGDANARAVRVRDMLTEALAAARPAPEEGPEPSPPGGAE